MAEETSVLQYSYFPAEAGVVMPVSAIASRPAAGAAASLRICFIFLSQKKLPGPLLVEMGTPKTPRYRLREKAIRLLAVCAARDESIAARAV
jgi:hypothetical protein